jgi:hypothetical protein
MSEMKVTVETRGLQEVIRNEPKRVDAWLRGVATEMVNDIKLSFNSGPGGRSYKRGARWHVASVAGSPPNSDTGNEKNSIRYFSSGDHQYTITDGWEYGELLELGTSRMAARPFFAPVFNAWQVKIEDDAARNLNLE